MSAIVLEGLTKTYGSLIAVDEVSLQVNNGELFGLLGPNGAGKTTILNMLTTLIQPSRGRAEVAGSDICGDPDTIRKNIGIVFQDPSLDYQLTGRENLDFHAMMYGMPADQRRQQIDEVLRIVDLEEKADLLVEQYSGGMKRRLEIARGLIHQPRILFLDEPTLGLDAQTRRKIWEYIRTLNRKIGITVILTTHYLEEADYLCDRIAVIDHGRIIALDTPLNLKTGFGGENLILECQEKSVEQAAVIATAITGATVIWKNRGALSVAIQDPEKHIPEIVSRMQAEGIALTSVSIQKPTLEDVFLSLTGHALREEKGSFADQIRSFTMRGRRQ